jgi:precorrin-2 dehydrogenase / sirohydrochlorin ferrochelatase
MAAFAYPVNLEVTGRTAVVIGEDAVAQGKDRALASAGARVVVRSESDWRPEDLDGAFLCVAASSDPEIREAVFRAARERGVLVNVMDDVARCDFAAPAVVRRGDLTITVSTGGRSPALARRLRERLERQFGPEWAEALEALGEVRAETLHDLPDLAERSRRWAEALDLEELTALVRTGRRAEAKARLRARLLRAKEPEAALAP